MSAPNLFIRADGSSAMGTGHVMRCVALAQGWRAAGGEAQFLCAGLAAGLRVRLGDEGFAVRDLPAPHPDPADLAATLGVLDAARPGDWLALDGYHFTTEYQAACLGRVRLLVVDDLAHLAAYHCSALLNQNPYAPDLAYPPTGDALLLLGPEYALLRDEFLHKARSEARTREAGELRVLATFGGADPAGACGLALRGLARAGLDGLSVKLVAGPANPALAELQAAAAGLGFPVEVLAATPDMASLMAWADLAVCAAGSTCWELAHLGVPSVVLETADNQRLVARSLAESEAFVVLGDSRAVTPEQFAAAVRGLARDAARRTDLAARAMALVDGQGRTRVVEALRGIRGRQ